MSNFTISILMPVYNSQKYLKNTVQDVINQSYKDWELILVDDGSKDNSKNICIELQKSDSRIRFISKKNEGVSSTRNTALDNARGKYIAFIDSDDSVNKDYLKNNNLKLAKINTINFLKFFQLFLKNPLTSAKSCVTIRHIF